MHTAPSITRMRFRYRRTATADRRRARGTDDRQARIRLGLVTPRVECRVPPQKLTDLHALARNNRTSTGPRSAPATTSALRTGCEPECGGRILIGRYRSRFWRRAPDQRVRADPVHG